MGMGMGTGMDMGVDADTDTAMGMEATNGTRPDRIIENQRPTDMNNCLLFLFCVI